MTKSSPFRISPRGKLRWTFFGVILLALIATMYNGLEFYTKERSALEKKLHAIQALSFLTLPEIVFPKWPPAAFRLGLDLRGGTHLVYQADLSKTPEKEKVPALEGARDVIERRINLFGVAEPIVQTVKVGNDYRVIVELAGVNDISQAIQMIGDTPLLEFKTANPAKDQPAVSVITAEQQKELDAFNADKKKRAEEILRQAKEGASFDELAKSFSEDELTKEKGGEVGWLSPDSRGKMLYDIGAKGKTNELYPELVADSEGVNVVKVLGSRDSNEIAAQHLLICYAGAQSCDKDTKKEDAKKQADDIKKQATQQNFTDLAKKYSTEGGANTRGGDLGWFGKGTMVKEFEGPAFALAKGQISDVIETPFGFHVIYKKDERTVKQYNVALVFLKTKTAADYQKKPDEWLATALTGKQLKRAYVDFDPQTQAPEVGIEFNDEGKKLFGDLTAANVGKEIAIFLDAQPISIPRVNQAITEGKAVITGNFALQEAKLLAQRLNTGALPVPVTLVSQQTVGASLGNESLQKSLHAGLIGFALVALFMILFYRLPGVLAVLALCIYAMLTLALFKIWPVTLSLAGIAGFILSVGMAVDANILIFERMKEELRWGKNLDGSIRDGFVRAWTSIRDSNVSSLITCFILFWFSASLIKGFALTLALGIGMSMFTAIVITKMLLNIVSGWKLKKNTWLFNSKKDTSAP